MGKPCQLVFQYQKVDEKGRHHTDKHHTCAGCTHDVLHVHHDAGNQEIAACVVKGSLGSPVKH